MWGWLFGKQQHDNHDALRAHFLLNEHGGFVDELPSEADFQAWLVTLDPDDVAFAEDMGTCALERLEGGAETESDFWDFIGVPEGRTVWGGYQRANQGWGVVQWVGRITAWWHGIPWF